MEKRKALYIYSGVIVLAVVLLLGIVFSNSKSSTAAPDRSLSDLIARVPNGVYESNQTYAYHAGTDTIDIKVKVQEGLVSDISVTPVGNVDRMSEHFITGVNDALPSLVDGKRIDQVNLPTQISGSSLTTATVKKYLESLYS